MYREIAEKFGNQPAFGWRVSKGVFDTITFANLYERGKELATGLLDIGITPGQIIAILSDNRLEWIISDYAIQMIGCANVPRGRDITDGEIKYILPHSDSVAVFVENTEVLTKIQRNIKSLKQIKHIILMDPQVQAAKGVLRLQDLIEKGKKLLSEGKHHIDEIIDRVKPDDLFTLIYTSGTTGVPKGVMLEQRNMISQVKNRPEKISIKDRAISILPVWHVYERVAEMVSLSAGACTYYTNPRNIRDDLIAVKPTYMFSAPRIWESVYQGIIKKVESGPALNRILFKIAYHCSEKFNSARRFLTFRELDTKGRKPLQSLVRGAGELLILTLYSIPYLLFDAVALSKIRAATGGRLSRTVSGGGALPTHIDLFFNNVGIKVLEGYGLTETCPVLAVRMLNNLVIGTVGPMYPHTEIKLLDVHTGEEIYPPRKGVKGEIHVRGPQVMRGYYKNEEATNKVLKDGWFNTGDLGMITFNNCLKIVGRSKETIVLLSGENVEPDPIERKLIASPLIEQVMVTGQDKKYLTALVVPALDQFTEYGSSLQDLQKNEKVVQTIRGEIKGMLSVDDSFKPFERVIDIRILPKIMEVGDELTNTYKIKRDVVTERYAELIDSMY